MPPMNDDIVTRLREELLGFHQHLSQWEINAERREAADEIERLRAIIAEYERPVRIRPVSSIPWKGGDYAADE